MPKDKLEPSQWVVDVVALSGAASNFLHEAGGVITTGIAIASVSGVVGLCVWLAKDLPTWGQVLLGTSGIASINYDPKKGQTAISQQFQQPVDNAIATTAATTTAVTEPPVSPSSYTLPQIDNDLDDNGEWLTPQEAAAKY